jgi:hypothetical protein
VPLGVLQTGGVIVTAPPCDQKVDYWERDLSFDHRLDRVRARSGDKAVQEVPYIFATILGADLSVPQIVQDRSAEIMKRLTDPQVAQRDIAAAYQEADKLKTSLQILSEWERFRRQPTKGTFVTTFESIKKIKDHLDVGVQSWLLNSFYQVTGEPLGSFDEYAAWLTRCGDRAQFDTGAGRYSVDYAIQGTDQKACWQQ